jgi:UDP-glucose 4-epimerase
MAEGFCAMGDTVIALDSQFDAATRARLAHAELVQAPLNADVLATGRQLDLVIHGAAITTPPEDLGLSAQQHIDMNVGLLRIGLQLALSHGAADFVFLSSSGVFALEDGGGVHLESTQPTATMPYAQAKRAGEDATSAANSPSLRAISARLGPIYGPHEVTRNSRRIVSQIRRWLDRVASDQPIIVQMPDERRDWTFAPDLPRALDALLGIEPKIAGIVHLTSAGIVSNLELAHLVASLVDGASIDVEPANQPARLPMVSDRLDLAVLHDWTPLAQGIAQTFDVEAAR